MTNTSAAIAAWTCPFCPLACDHLSVEAGAPGAPLSLRGGTCGRASAALATYVNPVPELAAAGPEIDGQPCSLDAAVAVAAGMLAASRQPLFAGLGTDVAGSRALYPLACATGAICDAYGGDALMHTLRALQDRGQFTTTLAEVRTRADLIVFIGGLPVGRAPLVGVRFGIGEAQVPQRHVVVLGPAAGDDAVLAGWSGAGVTVEALALHGDLFNTVSLLAALVAERPLPQPAPVALVALAQRLREARYAVLCGATSDLPPQGTLIVEAVNRIVGQLNARTRAAALWIGGANGSGTANQVFTWLSGLPMRARAGPLGLEHEPVAFASARVLADGAADALLWVSSFDAQALPPPTDLPMVVLGHPAQAAACRRPGTVFIAVATPGIGTDGHVFRTDGTELLPLRAVVADGLPSVAEIARRVAALIPAGRPA